VAEPIDVVEEVGRVYGIGRIPATLPGSRHAAWTPATAANHEWNMRQVLLGAGFDEVVTPALVSRRTLERLGIAREARSVINPMSDELDTMRTSLLPSLLAVARFNQNRTAERVDVFEMARVYLGTQPDGLASEPLRLTAVARVGDSGDAGREGFLRLKSVMDRLAADLAAGPARYERGSPALYHPGRAAKILLGGRELGVLGELHPSTLKLFDLDGRVVALDVDAHALISAQGERKAGELPRYPAVQRDLALIVEDGIPAADLQQVIQAAAGASLEEAHAFDEYRGGQVGAGRKSVAFTLTFRSPERTLTDAEVDGVMADIRKALEARHGAGFRS
jgi:phenylalanyl-tRNA synthetase beta chain